MLELNTFSIVARCANQHDGRQRLDRDAGRRFQLSACQGRGQADRDAIWVNPYLGLDGIRLLSEGFSAGDTLERLLADDGALAAPDRHRRRAAPQRRP